MLVRRKCRLESQTYMLSSGNYGSQMVTRVSILFGSLGISLSEWSKSRERAYLGNERTIELLEPLRSKRLSRNYIHHKRERWT